MMDTTQHTRSPSRLEVLQHRVQLYLLPVCMVAVTLFMMAISVKWRPRHDTPLMMYCGFIMEEFDKVPYRDFFDMNAPGTHLLHQGVVKVIGTSELGQRVWDLLWLLATQAAIVIYLRRWGPAVGLCAACALSVQYLSWGPSMSLEREYLCLLPLILTLMLAFRRPRWPLALRALAAGGLMGGMATIKPQFLLFFPFFLIAMLYWDERGDGASLDGDKNSGAGLSIQPPWTEKLPAWLRPIVPVTSWRRLCWVAAAATAGLIVFPAICAGYLLANGAWGGFREMFSDYWPLYSEIRGDATVRGTPLEAARVWLAVKKSSGFMFLGITAVSVFVAVPVLIRRGGRQAVEIWSLIGLCVLGATYAFVSGKFWPYHMLPLFFGYSLLAGLSLLSIKEQGSSMAVGWLRTLLLVTLFVQPLQAPEQAARILAGESYGLYEDTQQIALLLQQLARPGDQVQPFDVTSGAVHSMLLAKVDIATPFVYDFHFYHHPHSEVTQRLRRRMITSMEASNPRFAIVAKPLWRPRGARTATNFPELEKILLEQYQVVWSGARMALLERRPAS